MNKVGLFAQLDGEFGDLEKINGSFLGISRRKQRLTVDLADRRKTHVDTSIDCYVTGTYIDNRGMRFSIKQRYKIDISYDESNIIETMGRLRNIIINDFKTNYPEYNIEDVFIPDLPRPIPNQEGGFYKGSWVFKFLTRRQQGLERLKKLRQIHKANKRSILKRFGINR